MDKHNDRQTQRRIQTLREYAHALQGGDLEVVAAVLGAAENDPILEALLLEVDRLSQAGEDVTVSADQLLQARRFLTMLRAEAQSGTNYAAHSSSTNHLAAVTEERETLQEVEVQSMHHEPSPMPLTMRARRITGSSKTRFVWAAGFLRTAAALLLVGALIAGFLLVLSPHAGLPRQTAQTHAQTSSPPGIYISRRDGVYRLDVQSRKVIWHKMVGVYSVSSPRGRDIFPGYPVIIGDTVYIFPGVSGDDQVSALDAQTGTLRWTHDYPGGVVGHFVDNGVMYFSTIPFLGLSAVYAVNPANGMITTTYTPIPIRGQQFWNVPTVEGGYLYYLTNSSLFALQLPSGKLAWQQPLGNGPLIADEIIVQNGIVYVQVAQVISAHDNGLIEAFDAHTGSKLWQSPAVTGPLRVTIVTNEMIYAAPVDNELLAFNIHTHALVWRKSFDTFNMQAVSDRLYIECCSDSGQLAALNATTGNLLWLKQSTSYGLHLVGVQGGVLYGEGWSDDGQHGIVAAWNASTGTQLWTMPTGLPFLQWGGIAVA